MSHENSKIHIENLEKEIRPKENIIDQLLLDLLKISTQSTHHPQAELSVDYQELASMEYSINPPNHSLNNEPDADLAIQKLEVPSRKRKVTYMTS